MNRIYITIFFLFQLVLAAAQSSAQLPHIRVSANHRTLETADGKPFFWLGDTAWELFHRLNREEILEYLDARQRQGFNVVQAVALAEFDGLRTPNAYGDLPLVDLDPSKLAISPGSDPAKQDEYDYWDHVDFAIQAAAERGIYIGLLPTWGDKVAHLWGDGPIVFNEKNAFSYGKTLAERFRSCSNVLWILGGDRPAKYKGRNDDKPYDDTPIWRSMAQGIQEANGKQEVFITYHPWGGENSTTQYIHNEAWLDMNSFQSGHGSREALAWDWVERDLEMSPPKPTLDMEPCYEDHPVNPWDGKWTRQRGYFFGYDVRARIFRSVFAGGCGVTYGDHFIWQFSDGAKYPPINNGDTLIHWRKAMYSEAATQLKHLKALMLSRPYTSRIADQRLILSENPIDWRTHIRAFRDEAGTYAMFYLPDNQTLVVDLNKISGNKKKAWWFDPRTGKCHKAKPSTAMPRGCLFSPPSGPYREAKRNKNKFYKHSEGQDWVLVIDDNSKKYPRPGTKLY